MADLVCPLAARRYDTGSVHRQHVEPFVAALRAVVGRGAQPRLLAAREAERRERGLVARRGREREDLRHERRERGARRTHALAVGASALGAGRAPSLEHKDTT